MPETGALDYLPIYQALDEKGIKFVVIGGQACNIWSLIYKTAEPELDNFQPFTSRDLDICANSQKDVVILAETLGEKPILNDPSSSSPELGFVFFHSGGMEYPVTFLSGSYGINDPRKIFDTRQTLALGASKTPVHVMHPFLTMKGKVALVAHPPRNSGNDIKHLRMSILYLRSFLKSLALGGYDRDAIRLCKSIVKLALEPDAIRIFHRFDIKPESAILPLHNLEKYPKLSGYLESTLPGMIAKIDAKRVRLKPCAGSPRGTKRSSP